MILPLSFEFKCKTLEIESDTLGRGHRSLIWSLYGSKHSDFRSFSSSTESESVIKFKDRANLSDKLLTEINFKTQLHQVGSLELRSIRIALDWDRDKPVEKRKHTISITGHGRHSMMDYEPSEFNFNLYSNSPMNILIEEILMLAVGNN